MDFEQFLITPFSHWSLYLHQNQYFLVRVYIWSHRSGFVDLMGAAPEEREELFHIGNTAKVALGTTFQPDLFNWVSLGNLSRQCHMHVIPRYEQPRVFSGITFRDDRWNKNYAPYNYDFSVPEHVLFEIRDVIRDAITT